MVSPGWPGGLNVLVGKLPPSPNTFFLKYVGSIASVTVSKFSVRPS